MADYGLPDGVTLPMVAAVLIPVAIVTVALRALPFAFIKAVQGSPLIEFLRATMPVGVMVVLVAYTLASTRDQPGGLWAALAATAATIAFHAWRRRPGLSILAGTVVYMLLVNLL
ncbi:branched-chain amino acid transporter permease [Corynebacterium aquatimens]|uniref:Branched-subunit amino acid transport protein AzlD n=1 Tax=Corynebacterium aquatimens TaxID=1190508 RepID=A0A931GUF8_9CORY|nr:AzlD domain-containing protein [Corynebacterium aquatimens]MBG6122730.1 branched-subunit amino acid transport protein AzlD [Corynebacterium aquatimens]WJY66933.1 Branched-chain amino acid transport protein (AzlD) [Corynebacterium aquatimens]